MEKKMIFDDYFYPGNPARRQEVGALLGQIRATLIIFKKSWNNFASLINPLLTTKHADLKLATITCNPDSDDINTCVQQFQSVLLNANGKFNTLAVQIGIQNGIQGLPANSAGLDSDPQAAHRLGLFLGGAADAAVASIAAWYVYNTVQVFGLVLRMMTVTVSEIALVIGGALGGMIVGAVGFVITDIIASAITGAIERHQLNEAIDSLIAFKNGPTEELLTVSSQLGAIALFAKVERYPLSDKYYLCYDKSTSQYKVGEYQQAQTATLWLQYCQAEEIISVPWNADWSLPLPQLKQEILAMLRGPNGVIVAADVRIFSGGKKYRMKLRLYANLVYEKIQLFMRIH